MSNNDITKANSGSLADLLDVDPLVPVESNANRDEEFKFAKDNIKEALSLGNQALAELFNVVSQSQQARAFEAFTEMLKVVVSANKEFVETKQIEQDMLLKTDQGPKQEINNNLILTTADLSKILKEKMKESQ